MKKNYLLKFIISLASLFILLSCNFDNLGNSEDTKEETSQEEKTTKEEETGDKQVTTIPDIESGEYMVSGSNPNQIFKVDKAAGKLDFIGYWSYGDYIELGTEGDLLNEEGVSDYITCSYYVDFTSSSSAYKFENNSGIVYYVWKDSSGKVMLTTKKASGTSSSSNLLLLTSDIKAQMVKPANGKYKSVETISLDGTELYLYASVSKDGENESVTFYTDASADITDFTSLTEYIRVEYFSYYNLSFIPRELIYEDEDAGLIILTSSKFFKVKKTGAFDSVKMEIITE